MSSCLASGTSIIGCPERFGVWIPSSSRHSRTVAVFCHRSARSTSPRFLFRSNPASVVAREAIGDGPEYRYGGAAVLSERFIAGVQVEEGGERGIRLREARDENNLVVTLVE